MPILGFLILALLGACLSYLFYAGRRGTNTSLLREFYGCAENETLAHVWPNGLLWLRTGDPSKPEPVSIGNKVELPSVLRVRSVHDTFALSLTTDGVFILVDNRRDDNIGTLRFDRHTIQAVTQLPAADDLSASRLGRQEAAVNTELRLTTGEHYWIQLPQSAYQALTA